MGLALPQWSSAHCINCAITLQPQREYITDWTPSARQLSNGVQAKNMGDEEAA
jgi:hypothetical protein